MDISVENSLVIKPRFLGPVQEDNRSPHKQEN